MRIEINSRLKRRGIWRFSVFPVLMACIAPPATAGPPTLQAEWSWTPSQGIEWVEQALPGRSELLVNTRDGSLHVFNLESGKALLTEPIPARPGLRPVPVPLIPQSLDPYSQTYCFDRFTVLAVRLMPQPGLAWRVGTWCEGLAEPAPPGGADPNKTFQGDPEELCQLLAAAHTPWGVIVARNDGRFGLLDRADGRVVWQHKFEAIALARLHVWGSEAALLWRSGPEVHAISMDVRTGRFREYPILSERPWPFWSSLISGGLVLIEPEGCIFATPRSAQTVFSTPAGTNIIAASVALQPESPTAETSTGPVVIFGTSDGVLRAINPQDGREYWTATHGPAMQATGGAVGQSWTWVKLLGDLVVSAAGETAQVRAASTGDLLAEFKAETPVRLLDAAVIAGRVWILLEHAAGQPRFELVSVNQVTQTAPAGDTETPRFRLDQPGIYLGALWADRHLVVSTRSGIAAFVIP